MPPDAPLPNTPESRTETGELKPVATTTTAAETTTQTTDTTTKPDGTTSETKPSTEAKPEAKDDKSLLNKDEPQGAPEKYEPFKVPDGFEIPEAVSTEANALFKGLNLSQAQAQQLIDFYAAKNTEAANAPYELYADMRRQWQDQVKADPEIGKILPKVKETVSRALDSLGDSKLASDFREAMDLTGAGDHPAFIKAFYKFAERLTEGSHVSGTGPSVQGQRPPGAAPRSAASAIFPNLPSATSER